MVVVSLGASLLGDGTKLDLSSVFRAFRFFVS